MEHSFDVDIACKYGLEEAIFIKHFRFWIEKNVANGRHRYDGRTWTYNSVKAFQQLFPYRSPQQIVRILNSLVDKQVLVSGNYNPTPYDRTKWYAFSDKCIFEFQIMDYIETNKSIYRNQQMDLPKQQNGFTETDKPIPYAFTYNKPDKDTDIRGGVPYQDVINLYNETCTSLPRVIEVTNRRKNMISVRWLKYNKLPGGGILTFQKLFEAAERSDFLTGRDGKWNNCNFDWLLNETNMVKVLEGNYKNKNEPKEEEVDYEEKAQELLSKGLDPKLVWEGIERCKTRDAARRAK